VYWIDLTQNKASGALYERGDEPWVKLFYYRPGQDLRVRGH